MLTLRISARASDLTGGELVLASEGQRQITGARVAVQQVSRSFGRGKKARIVLKNLDLEVAAGTAIWIGGRNGAGKTTLLRIVTGILAPDSGQVWVNGLSSEHQWREFHGQIGFLSAGDRGLYQRLSVRGHLEYWAALAFVPRAERSSRVQEALHQFGLIEVAGRRSERLSQGQRQRLRLALTVVHRPSVLLLDEPRNSLDSEGLEILAAAVGDVVDRQGAVLWCSPPEEDQPVEFHRMLLLEDGALRPR